MNLQSLAGRFAGKKSAVLGAAVSVLAFQAESIGAVEFSRLLTALVSVYFLGQGLADFGKHRTEVK